MTRTKKALAALGLVVASWTAFDYSIYMAYVNAPTYGTVATADKYSVIFNILVG